MTLNWLRPSVFPLNNKYKRSPQKIKIIRISCCLKWVEKTNDYQVCSLIQAAMTELADLLAQRSKDIEIKIEEQLFLRKSPAIY